MDSNTKLWRSLFLLLAGLVSLPACTLRVEKIAPYGINSQHFDFDDDIGSWQDSLFLMCCNGTVSTPEGELEKGRYQVTLLARGSQANQVFPTLKVMLDRKLLREVQLDSNLTTYQIPFELEERNTIRIKVRFDQDGLDNKGNDRNVWIRSITVDTAGH